MVTKYRYMHTFEVLFGHRLSTLNHILCLKVLQSVCRRFQVFQWVFRGVIKKYRYKIMFEDLFGQKISK